MKYLPRVCLHLGCHFRPLSPKSRHPKIDCFSDPAFSTENRPRGPQSRHHGRSGARKAPKMEPKMTIFRGPAEKCEFEPLLSENLVFAVQRGPRIAPNFDVFFGRPFRRLRFAFRDTENADRGGFRRISGRFWGSVRSDFRYFSGSGFRSDFRSDFRL